MMKEENEELEISQGQVSCFASYWEGESIKT